MATQISGHWTTDPIYCLNHCLTLPASIHQNVRRYSNFNLRIKCIVSYFSYSIQVERFRNDLYN